MARAESDKDPEEQKMKQQMAELICHTIRKRGWTQSEAAIMLGTTQNKISGLSPFAAISAIVGTVSLSIVVVCC